MFTKLFLIVCVAAASLSHSVAAQQPKIPRIGYLVLGFPSRPPTAAPPNVEAFYRGLQDQGFTAGKNVIIDYRFAKGKSDNLRGLAAELVTSKVDLIFATSTPAINAARHATTRIPIVVVSVVDPVAAELVDSLSRPGGNITGVSNLRPELNGKLLELLAEAVPRVNHFGVLWHPATSSLSLTESAARALNVKLTVLAVRSRDDLENTFGGITKNRVGALVILPAVLFARSEKRLAELTINNRLPAIFSRSDFAEKGGYMSYGPNGPDQFRRAGVLAGKLLKGTKPADLPVEQPMKFELVINLKTAKQIGVTISPNVLARADRVIK